jgi:hypothetical protein
MSYGCDRGRHGLASASISATILAVPFQRSISKRRFKMADKATSANQKKILSNQKEILSNQKVIRANQGKMLVNQRTILSNQAKILAK